VLDGIEAAFDEDRVGWAPPGATLPAGERRPQRFAAHRFRLRLASVRWVLSFRELSAGGVQPRGAARIPGVLTPLRVFELPDALPRALWVPGFERAAPAQLEQRILAGDYDPERVVLLEKDPPRGSAPEGASTLEPEVAYDALDPHTVRIRARTPPGLLVVTNGYHRDWTASDQSGPVPLLRANGRYWAIPTPGGDRTFVVRYRPRWLGAALLALGVGGILSLALFILTPRVGEGTISRLSTRET
jgi:hypothetical protein